MLWSNPTTLFWLLVHPAPQTSPCSSSQLSTGSQWSNSRFILVCHIILLVLVEIVGTKGALLVELSFLLKQLFLLHAGVEFLS